MASKIISKNTIPRDVRELLRVLTNHGYEAYIVGGCVRDLVMGIKPADYDITTDCRPERTEEIFRKAGFKAVPTGLKFGTVTVISGKGKYEVTTYRKETLYSDGRRPDKIFFSDTIHEDLKRRDFTINAMAYSPLTEEFIDLFDGLKDIRKKIVRAIGNPEERFGEDHLRMLRAVRFASRFGYKIEPRTSSAIKKLASKIQLISGERVFMELVKMAERSGIDFASSLVLLKKTGLLLHVLPEIDKMDKFKHGKDAHPEGNVWKHTLGTIKSACSPNSTLNLACLFHDIGKVESFTKEKKGFSYRNHPLVGVSMIKDIAIRLRMPNELRDILSFTAENHMKVFRFAEMKTSNILKLITHKYWDVLYAVVKADALSRLGAYEKEHWKKIDHKIKRLKNEYKTKSRYEKIRKTINGDLVMRVKKIPSGKKVGECIEKTVEWIIDNSIDLNDLTSIANYIREL
ncbi:MAG: CCA tRNA nucleotidyltransferase [Candidatus Omnitrophica bacterium]|nr:CCA tRNA nucleotidyltransferase [Candidatus Omnitrophota bacterium]